MEVPRLGVESELLLLTYSIATATWNLSLSIEKKQSRGLGEQTCGFQGRGGGVGWIGNLGLIEANYCPWNG